MNCYGKSFNKLAECRTCRWKRLCMTAADPPLMAMNTPSEKATRYILAHARSDTGNRMLRAERDRRYTKADLLEVITFMAALDIRSLTLVAQKLECPELNFSELAEIRGVSRQAMHKMVEKRLHSRFRNSPPFSLFGNIKINKFPVINQQHSWRKYAESADKHKRID